ncbi:hypothetical protein DM860_010991 [Cuscuta australis]|uniref:Uncharacterized protein n=1 Tax=Cuscuta australis TaxID=267555 RepID=A0A328E4G8_9ASTE|nr:hypothetical protein DM860_010991 [Cuscuta australis]
MLLLFSWVRGNPFTVSSSAHLGAPGGGCRRRCLSLRRRNWKRKETRVRDGTVALAVTAVDGLAVLRATEKREILLPEAEKEKKKDMGFEF